ncbi:MAG: regulatory protein RecX [Candidatus Omnitrophota bacterium]
MPSEKKDTARAKAYALRLLKYRQKSEQEIRRKLLEKGYGPDVIEETIVFLKKTGLVDDRLFARLWVESRIKRPLGRLRLKRELKEKGIAPAWIDEAFSGISGDYDEKETIRGIIRLKRTKMRELDAEKMKARLFGYLVRRGFPQGAVVEAILEEVRE